MSKLSYFNLFSTILNSITVGLLGWHYYVNKQSPVTTRQTTKNQTPFTQLIHGNQRHQQKKCKKIAAAIVKGDLDVNTVFDTSDFLYVIKIDDNNDFYEQESWNVAIKLEYAYHTLGIRTFFIIGGSNDTSVLKSVLVESPESQREILTKIKSTLKPMLSEIISCLSENLKDEINKNLKPYYAVYDDLSGYVTFYHYDSKQFYN